MTLPLRPYPSAQVDHAGVRYALARLPSNEKVLLVHGDASGFAARERAADGAWMCPLDAENAAALRARLPWLAPAPLGLHTSAGFGDRLGLATPGHVRAVVNTGIAPIFAQQSVRENARTGRTPQQVMDDAAWGLFQAGWGAQPWGADADHLKQPADLPAFLDAGYTFFTIDPGEHVQAVVDGETLSALRARLGEAQAKTLCAEYLDRDYNLGDARLVFDERGLLAAAIKYARAVAHAAEMFRLLERSFGSRPFDFEVSVDETDSPTTPLEHLFIASELARQGVRWVSLAPRFVGAFEKGVDYIGDLAEFEAQVRQHAAVARAFGGYKLSLHSGSDKFSIYPIAARHTAGRVHLKTAGTSYLEALRVAARLDPALFRQVYVLSRTRYETDRASYHVSARLERTPEPAALPDAALPGLLDQFDARQVLHVAFGAALAEYGGPLRAFLDAHEEAYAQALAQHFARHLEAFTSQTTRGEVNE